MAVGTGDSGLEPRPTGKSRSSSDRSSPPPKSYRLSLTALSVLFFALGFVTCLNDILLPHLKASFQLSFGEAAMIQSAFFAAYFCCGLPAGAAVRRLGYKRGAALGLLIAAGGAALFIPADQAKSFPIFLAALFILAGGMTTLQVAVNPYVTLLGPQDSASSRLNLTQGFNSLGTTLAPAVGGFLFLGAAVAKTASDPAAAASQQSVSLPYAVIAGLLLLMAAFMKFYPLDEPRTDHDEGSDTFKRIKEALKVRRLQLAIIGIFVYVGAEVAIGSFLVTYVVDKLQLGDNLQKAAFYVSIYWGAAMVGRFLGSALMSKIQPKSVLLAAAAGAIALVALSIITDGPISVYAILAVGLCNSIMFPTIFSLGISELGDLTSAGSSLIMMAVVGGAIIPPVMGVLADNFDLRWAYALPILCYLYIAYFAALSGKGSAKARTA